MSRLFRVHLVTWRVDKLSPPGNLAALLGLEKKELPALIAIGLQEIKPDTTKAIIKSISENEWTERIVSILSPLGYVRVRGQQIGGLQLSVYIQKEFTMGVREVECKFTYLDDRNLEYISSGIGIRVGCEWGNICFVNSCIKSRSYQLNELCKDLLNKLKFSNSGIMEQDCLFWMGYGFPLRDPGSDDLFENFVKCPTSIPGCKPTCGNNIFWRDSDDVDVKQDTYRSHGEYKGFEYKPVTSTFTIELMPLYIWPPFVKDPNEVKFNVRPIWYKGKDLPFAFVVREDSSTSDSDWIGLYKVDFKSFDEYVARVRVPLKGANFLRNIYFYHSYFPAENLSKVPVGTYKLFYFNDFKDYVVGHSDEFQIVDQDQHDHVNGDMLMDLLPELVNPDYANWGPLTPEIDDDDDDRPWLMRADEY